MTDTDNDFNLFISSFTLFTPYIYEGDTPSPFGTQYSGGDLDGTQYAKGRYAIRRNSVISYADINFYFQKVQFSSKNTTHMTYKVK